eukprot:gnl/TRDRNA2_/TRDRNA2_170903_c0_seq1.p1 gnl/TRDRNA2_/TRDRNA2_170903_c0~~gnl/TRDRNA2_/TRDRNA2_170903_c0_seq1.p1  ORF type:complete len:161 (+),score=19.98 gnl/TRDRNA2_/TRDRNA2_170903_c0_seq1:160-642(+)
MRPRSGSLQSLQVPAGEYLPGETARECAARTLRNDTGLDPDMLEIDWDKKLELEVGKYSYFLGRLGAHQPRPSHKFVDFMMLPIEKNSVRLSENSYICLDLRLRYVLGQLRSMHSNARLREMLFRYLEDMNTTKTTTTTTTADMDVREIGEKLGKQHISD